MDVEEIVRRSVALLANVTRQVAIVQYPLFSSATIRHVDVLALGAGRGLVMVVSSSGTIGQRFVPLSDSDEQQVSRIRGRIAEQIAAGMDIRPTIAVTKAHIHLPEVRQAMAFQRLKPDGRILLEDGSAAVTKIAVEPVWWLPGVARRFGVSEAELRRALFEETGGMYPELVTRSDIEVFLPPIGGQTLYVFGDVRDLADPSVTLTARIHDECNGSDVFGSDICTCRPYLTHAIEECIEGAQSVKLFGENITVNARIVDVKGISGHADMNGLLTGKHERILALFRKLDHMTDRLGSLSRSHRPVLDGEHYLTDRELSGRLKISRRTLQEYRNEGRLPYIQLGEIGRAHV